MAGSYIVSGMLGLAVAGLAWMEARTFPLQDLPDGLGAAFMPWLLLAVIVALSLALIGYGLSQCEWRRPALADLRPPPGLAVTGTIFLLLCGFVAAFAYFGLLVPALVFLVIGMRILEAPWAKALTVGATAGLCIYVVFAIAFGVQMP